MRLSLQLLSIALFISVVAGHAQSPPGINYQGVARNLDGKPLVLKDITIKIGILKNGDNSNIEYAETHSLKTNSFGLFTLVIGTGSVTTGDFRYISWADGNKWLRVEMDPDGGNSFQIMGSQQFMSVPYAFYAKYSGNSLSPGQGISITNNVITNTGDADNNSANELNTSLTLSSDRKLRVTDAGGTKEVDLSPLVVTQTLSGVLELDNDAGSQSITNLSDPLSETDAATKKYVDVAVTNAFSNADQSNTNELQEIVFDSNKLSLTNTATEIDLSSYLDNTDKQELSFAGNTLSIGGGNSVDLSTLAAPQTLGSTSTGTARSITISGGNSISFDVADNDNIIGNEFQDLSLDGSHTLRLSNDASAVSLAPYLDNTDNQQLRLIGHALTLDNDATPVDLSPYLADTDDQTLVLSGTNLSISDGNSVSLAGFMDDTDDQQLTLTGHSLSLEGDATPIDLTPYTEDNQSLAVSASGNNRTINITDGTGVTFSIADGDSDQTNEIQSLSYNVTTKSLSILPGNSVNIPETQNMAQVLMQGNDAGGQQITNLGAPGAVSDATTKQYVDNGDAAINTRISNNYAFKANFAYSNLLSIGNNIPIPFTGESFDAFGVVNTANFTAPSNGTYIFFVDGGISTLLGGPAVSLLYNGTKYPVAIGSNSRYNSTFMFQLTAGQTVSLVGDGLGVGASLTGSFFGYKLL
jgi:hypothetical protein